MISMSFKLLTCLIYAELGIAFDIDNTISKSKS